MWPPDERLHDARERLVADPDTGGAFAELVLAPLIAELAERNRFAEDHHVSTAAEVAVMAVIKHPRRYDPNRLPLRAYLLMIARRKLKTAQAAEHRHHQSRIPWDAVELSLPARNEEVEGDDSPSLDDPELQAVIAGFTTAERAVFDCLLGGERRTTTFAAALGLADQPADQQEADVKRVKDRIKARLGRARRKP